VNNGKLLIADLGLSKKMSEATTNSLANTLGMPEYTEPQCFKLGNYKKNKKSDIYSLGVLLWEISSGHRPFPNYLQNILQFHIGFNNLREKAVEGTPVKYQELYEKCWNEDPNLRPDIKEVFDILIKTEDFPNVTSSQPNINEINTISNIDYNDLSTSDYLISTRGKFNLLLNNSHVNNLNIYIFIYIYLEFGNLKINDTNSSYETGFIKNNVKVFENLEKGDVNVTNAENWIKDAISYEKVKLIPLNEFVNVECIKQGGFREISKAIWTKKNYSVIRKKFTKKNNIKHLLVAFVHELKIHLQLDYSERIVRCLGISIGNLKFCVFYFLFLYLKYL
jgi:serine/threonine protein kinase